MNGYKLRYHRKLKRHEKQTWQKEAAKIVEEEVAPQVQATTVKSHKRLL